MKFSKLYILLLLLPLFAFNSFHKYYISVTQVDYVQEKQSLQIITRIFIDDFENLLKERYDDTIVLDEGEELANTNMYIEKYLADKLTIKINGEQAKLNFIGKKYDLELVKCYLEVEDVKNINSIEISNKVLFDMFDDQQNIIKTKINAKQKSFMLTSQNNKAVLNFN